MVRVLVLSLLFLTAVAGWCGGERFRPGQVVPESHIARYGHEGFFSVSAVPDTVVAMMQGKSYKPACTVPVCSLRYVLCLHRDMEGRAIVGEMVVNRAIADDVVYIFRRLFESGYPIARMRLVDYWDAEDERSMAANNSSGFNFRYVSHTKKVSAHGLGMAVDINPLYNPYCKVTRTGQRVVEPAAGRPYLDRSARFPYKIERSDLCCRLFRERGFSWGGDWKSCKDYQHFEKKLPATRAAGAGQRTKAIP